MEGDTDYDMMKVAQLRLLCKQRALSADGKKEELVFRLQQFDTSGLTSGEARTVTITQPELVLTSDELRELATIADEMRHIRRQWVRFY